ncbi:MAG: hypothetical protein ACKVYV_03880 [Limisphaerales bacterium]
MHLPLLSPDGRWAAAALKRGGIVLGSLHVFDLEGGGVFAPPSGLGTNFYSGFEATDGPCFTTAGQVVFAGQQQPSNVPPLEGRPRTVRGWRPGTTNEPIELAAPGLPPASRP